MTTYYGSVGQLADATTDLGPAYSGKVCLLRGLIGVFRWDTFTAGVYTNVVSGNWKFTTQSNQGGYVDCVK